MAHKHVLEIILSSVLGHNNLGCIDFYQCIKDPLVLELDPSDNFALNKAYFCSKPHEFVVRRAVSETEQIQMIRNHFDSVFNGVGMV